MHVSWVLSDSVELSPTQDIVQLKEIGSLWGSFRTWRSCQTDNVICHEAGRARDLIKTGFEKHCNFYVPAVVYNELKEPSAVKAYGGDFEVDLDNSEEIIAMHLAASQSDIVLLLGFNWIDAPANTVLSQRRINYYGFVEATIGSDRDKQWVLVDHAAPVRKSLVQFNNLTTDTLDNVFDIFGKL